MTRFGKSPADSPADSSAQQLIARLARRFGGQTMRQNSGQRIIRILADTLLPLLCPDCRAPLAGAGL